MKVIRKDGTEVRAGDVIKTRGDGESHVFTRAESPSVPGKSGKIVVDGGRTLYAHIFDLTVAP